MTRMTSPGTRLRARLLALMSATVAAASACAGTSHEVPVPKDEVRRRDLPGGAWSVEFVHTESSPYPTCPDGDFCILGSGAPAGEHAPAPFENCEATMPIPTDPKEPNAAARNDNLMVSFNDFWTRNERTEKGPKVCCYRWVEPCPGGRPLRDADGVEICAAASVAPVDAPSERSRYWIEAARSEHASVASFARFTLELLALGAPAELARRAQRAALDEIEHARRAFALATRFAGARIEPGPLAVDAAEPLGAITPRSVLRGTVRDGCVNETIAALEARRRAAISTDDGERAALLRIAIDEEAHAALAFDAVDWLVATFGAELEEGAVQALDDAASTLQA